MESPLPSQDGSSEDQEQLLTLKTFRSAGKGSWASVSDAEWNDWKWQLKNRVTRIDQLERLLPSMTPEERAGVLLAGESKLAMAITPYYFNLIDASDELCPIRRQVIPRLEETTTAPWETLDPVGEDDHSPVPGLVHRYPDRVLLLALDFCSTYCRYCTRSRVVGHGEIMPSEARLEKAFEYIRNTPEIRDVLISGGPTRGSIYRFGRDGGDAVGDGVSAHRQATDRVDLVDHVAEDLVDGVGDRDDPVGQARGLFGVEEPRAGGTGLQRIRDLQPRHAFEFDLAGPRGSQRDEHPCQP